jgi:hypothetical protein
MAALVEDDPASAQEELDKIESARAGPTMTMQIEALKCLIDIFQGEQPNLHSFLVCRDSLTEFDFSRSPLFYLEKALDSVGCSNKATRAIFAVMKNAKEYNRAEAGGSTHI